MKAEQVADFSDFAARASGGCRPTTEMWLFGNIILGGSAEDLF